MKQTSVTFHTTNETLQRMTAAAEEVCRGNIMDYDGRTVRYYFNDRLDASMHGTGDVYASAVAGALCRGWSVYGAAALGADMVVEAMKATLDDKDHWYGVKFERALPYLMRRMEAGETETGC